ncbi:gp436 family protein [Pasteurella multocida]|uniref:gp436 family protein n=1 Tax=Pasteurella multocida TaxID=747 RepID=UPI001F537BD2|nr:phage protein Gp36 family protein [Pasteurella multocida]
MYATINDFISRVGEFQVMELTDRENIGEVNQAVLTIALSDSSSQIDGYLVGRYKLPLKTIPQNLTRICCDLTRYRLASMSEVSITEEIIERYKLSLRELEGIASGKVSLGIAEDEQASTGENTVIFTNVANRVFSRDN